MNIPMASFVTKELLEDIQASFSKRLAYCWICRNKLADAGGNALFLRNEHHVIPQAFGGADGPTISLDTAHHDQMHIIANNMMSGKDYKPLLKQFSSVDEQNRVLYLSTRVAAAAKMVEGDPNKRIATHFSLSRTENEAFRRLCDFHKLSKDSLVKKLIAQELARCFPSRK